jgi:hypothetical protein
MELHRRRRWRDGWAQRISYQEIDAWARATQRTPSVWQIEALVRMDDAWCTRVDDERAEAIRAADPNAKKMISADDTASLAAFFKSQPGRDVIAPEGFHG